MIGNKPQWLLKVPTRMSLNLISLSVTSYVDARPKTIPVYTGFVAYFPRAMAEVSRISLLGGIQHGQPRHCWDRPKSGDELDMMRHILDKDWAQVA